MTSPQELYKEINDITQKLISIGLSDKQNYPSSTPTGKGSCKIAYSKMQDLSIALRNVDYKEMYEELDRNDNYNVKMIDGALIQLMYSYENFSLVSHRLAFLPSPFLENFQNDPEIYEDDEIYADIIAKNILPVPIRFDYDPANHQELDHPKSHLTLGQFKNCRIPVCSPIAPSTFISFILRSFYNTAFKKFTAQLTFSSKLFDKTITSGEKKILHIAIE
jgi:hypothetical protein